MDKCYHWLPSLAIGSGEGLEGQRELQADNVESFNMILSVYLVTSLVDIHSARDVQTRPTLSYWEY